MSTTPQPGMDVGIWEKLGDFITAFSEGLSKFLTGLFGSSNERQIRKLGYIRLNDAEQSYRVTPGSTLDRVNQLEDQMRALSDEDLRGLTPKFRARLGKGESLDRLLPEAFAACREAGRRYKNMRHFDVQILGGSILHEGNIAEMVTGEGKTLVATLPAYLNALEGKGVHVVTVNDYLARRDCEWMLPIYQGLGLTAAPIQTDMDPGQRRKAYDCDITYGTNSEYGFDYLRDNMRPARWSDPHYPIWQQQCQKNLNYAIIDEVDNILIDEARTPLIISGPALGDTRRYYQANKIALQLKAGEHFEIKEKEHTCHLTDVGIHEAERLAGVESFYTAGNMEWPHLIDQSLKAHHLYKKDKQYVVMPHPETREQSVIIVDEFTGRLMIGRQWSDGLHQAVEAKEGVKIKEETQTLATVTLQNFFKLYNKLAGMTGTAMTEANEFWKIYKLDVMAMPTNRPLNRINEPDLIYRTEQEKWKAILDEVVEVNDAGRPILVGTVDVAKSELLGDMLKRKGIKYELLNAKPEYAAREAMIVAQAGRIGAVTIATNMAGRGTDIILGGNPEFIAWDRLKKDYETRLDVPPDVWKSTVDDIEEREKTKEEGRKVAELGGLHIIGTERHEARRIDNQLRGRAGRQGDPGSSRFFLSLQDDLMRIFAGEWVGNMLSRLGMQEGEAIESRMVSRRIEGAQKKVEERNFDIRKNLLEYDQVMDHQRKSVYGYRQKILDGANVKLLILEMLRDQVESAVRRFTEEDYGEAAFAEFAANRLGVEFDSSEFKRSTFEEAAQHATEKAARQAMSAIDDALEENLSTDVETSEWNWEALAGFFKSRWGIKTTARELKQIGRDEILNEMLPKAEAAVEKIELKEGAVMLQDDFGLQSLADWAKFKYQLELPIEELKDIPAHEITEMIFARMKELYTQKEIEFPVQVGVSNFMGDRDRGQGFNREGLYAWASDRFARFGKSHSAEDIRTKSRNAIRELLQDTSKNGYPADAEELIGGKLDEVFESTESLAPEYVRDLSDWARSKLDIELNTEELEGANEEAVRQVILNAFDEKYRPEMRAMERYLVLETLDSSWKDHLYAMDHLRSGIGLVGYAQVDPKTEYKRQGMKLFDEMWDGVNEKVTDLIFRMEERGDDVGVEQQINFGEAVHEEATSALSSNGDMRAQQDQAIAGSQRTDKKTDPIRRHGQRVGRNAPCPCGSGKKYKNCCMAAAV